MPEHFSPTLQSAQNFVDVRTYDEVRCNLVERRLECLEELLLGADQGLGPLRVTQRQHPERRGGIERASTRRASTGGVLEHHVEVHRASVINGSHPRPRAHQEALGQRSRHVGVSGFARDECLELLEGRRRSGFDYDVEAFTVEPSHGTKVPRSKPSRLTLEEGPPTLVHGAMITGRVDDAELARRLLPEIKNLIVWDR
jgi:hypothetical protein